MEDAERHAGSWPSRVVVPRWRTVTVARLAAVGMVVGVGALCASALAVVFGALVMQSSNVTIDLTRMVPLFGVAAGGAAVFGALGLAARSVTRSSTSGGTLLGILLVALPIMLWMVVPGTFATAWAPTAALQAAATFDGAQLPLFPGTVPVAVAPSVAAGGLAVWLSVAIALLLVPTAVPGARTSRTSARFPPLGRATASDSQDIRSFLTEVSAAGYRVMTIPSVQVLALVLMLATPLLLGITAMMVRIPDTSADSGDQPLFARELMSQVASAAIVVGSVVVGAIGVTAARVELGGRYAESVALVVPRRLSRFVASLFVVTTMTMVVVALATGFGLVAADLVFQQRELAGVGVGHMVLLAVRSAVMLGCMAAIGVMFAVLLRGAVVAHALVVALVVGVPGLIGALIPATVGTPWIWLPNALSLLPSPSGAVPVVQLWTRDLAGGQVQYHPNELMLATAIGTALLIGLAALVYRRRG